MVQSCLLTFRGVPSYACPTPPHRKHTHEKKKKALGCI